MDRNVPGSVEVMDVLHNRDELIAALRDPVTASWWDFRYRPSCAFGMVERMMRTDAFASIEEIADHVGLTVWQANRIFGNRTGFYYWRLFRKWVTPEMVARALEKIDGRTKRTAAI